jgi:hypothetical protein
MPALHDTLRENTLAWKAASWPVDEFPAMSEVLEWAGNPDGSGFVLRPPQFHALQVYWYLRLVEKTPRIRDLYQRLMPAKKDLLKAMGIPDAAFEKVDYDIEALWKAIGADDDFAREFKLQGLRETLSLDYPSYILALIVEIKDARFKAATEQDLANDATGGTAVTTEGRKAVALKRWEKLNPDRLKYQIVFADGDVIPHDKLAEARAFAGVT